MAGRGTDIQLGGNIDFRIEDELADMAEGARARRRDRAHPGEIAEEKQRVLDVGGLFVLGTERHESRRIDNQLRGRSGRQGDPGLSRFYLSLDDDLLRIFGPQTMFARLMNKNLEDGEAIVSPWISKAIETAQKKVEARNYDIRKQVVEFDDVMNDQRKVIYEQRADIMDAEDVSDVVADMRAETAASLVAAHCPPGTYPEQWDVEGLKESVDVDLRPAAADRRLARGRSGRAGDHHRAPAGARRRGDGGQDSARSTRSAGTRSRRTSCSRRSTITGRSIWRRWTRCARSSTCAATPRRSRSTNISRKPSCCSSGC